MTISGTFRADESQSAVGDELAGVLGEDHTWTLTMSGVTHYHGKNGGSEFTRYFTGLVAESFELSFSGP